MEKSTHNRQSYGVIHKRMMRFKITKTPNMNNKDTQLN
jgi:hypothetical protein